MEAIILAGGRGIRLQERVSDLPKPLAQVAGRPFIDHIVEQLGGAARIIVSAGYLADKIEAHFENSAVQVIVEGTPLGTGGALQFALQFCDEENVLVCNGDTYVDYDVDVLYKYHMEKGGALTILTRNVENAGRYGTLELEGSRIIDFKEKEVVGKGVINAGAYIVNKKQFLDQGFPESFSLETQGFPKMLQLGVYSFPSLGRFIDIGTPSSYDDSQKMFGANK